MIINKSKIIVFLSVIVLTSYGIITKKSNTLPSTNIKTNSEYILGNAFENRTSNLQVEGVGIVVHNLADDTHGSRHQKFIIKLSSNQSLLIAHNIDIAPRIPSLLKGDSIKFYGEYEWSPKGGLIHWTHDDPKGKHVNGWLQHNGVRYH